MSDNTANSQLALKLRHARLSANLTLKKLATDAGCSESLISKIERGSATPSLAMLHRLARALNTNIAQLMDEEQLPAGPVIYADKRACIESGTITLERIVWPSRNALLQGHIHSVAVGGASDGAIEHIGEEVGYVLEGEMELQLDGVRYPLSAGDAFHFASRLKHGYRNTGQTVLKILWINTPATF